MRSGQSETDLVYHRMGVVLAQVSSATARKSDARMRQARKIAADIELLARDLQDLKDGAADPAEFAGPLAAVELGRMRNLLEAAGRIAKAYPVFVKEHGALVAKDAQKSIAELLAWLLQRGRDLRARILEFEAAVAVELREDSKSLGSLARRWSSTDGDGLE